MELDDEIRQAFFDDAVQLVEGAEAELMSMDQGNMPKESIDALFRTAHNLKGGSMAMGFEQLSHFAHSFEDVLSLVKNGKLGPSKKLFDLLFRGIDTIKLFVTGIKMEPTFNLDTSALTAELKAVVANPSILQGDAPAAEPAPTAEAAPAEPATADSAPAPAPAAAAVPPPSPEAPKAKATEAKAAGAAPKTNSEDFIRVHTGKLDLLLNLIGELVINQSIMSRHRVESSTASDHALQTISYMEKLVNEVQDVSMSLRMTNVKSLFQKMQRTVRDISSVQGKEVLLSTEGEHVELDRTIIDRMNDPLTHLIRNAVDHGIEDTETRVAAGKSPRADVRLSAVQQDDTVLITVKDDGKGLDPKKLTAKAIEKGLLPPGTVLSNDDAYALIFKPGFSTKEQVTDISGRGVGMDVVARAVQEMKGAIRVQTEIGKGTTFTISLPLSLSIINGMVVGIGRKKYVIPVAQLVETIEYRKFKIESSTKDGRMINLRGEVIPVLSLERILGAGVGAAAGQGGYQNISGVVTATEGRKVSFEVDELHGQQQVVIKKLGPKLADLPGIIGGAILSNGEPSLVLNLHDLTSTVRRTNAA